MAAHTYRTWLWDEVGFATWNAQWYGGHHMAGYSLLYPPLAALAGTRLVGVVAGVAAVGLFAVLARRRAPTPAAGALAAWLFLGGVMSNVVIGRMPFTLGIALAVGAVGLRAPLAARGRRALAGQRVRQPGGRGVPRRRGRGDARRATSSRPPSGGSR